MNISASDTHLEIECHPPEAMFFAHVLEEVLDGYETPAGQLSPGLRSAWYDTRGCISSGMDGEATAEWIESLQEHRTERIALCRGWVDTLQALIEREEPGVWKILKSDAEALFQVLNDRRLALASVHEIIGEEQMDWNSWTDQSPEVRNALVEIHLLGELIQMLLEQLGFGWEPDAA
jgi:hypothetical protein